MTPILRFLARLRTSPRRAIVIEIAFIVLGAALLALAFFRMNA